MQGRKWPTLPKVRRLLVCAITNMNAGPLLDSVAAALAEVRLEAILIGNAAAAIQGAPVTTVDFDFMFRATPVNLGQAEEIRGAAGRGHNAPLLSRIGALPGDER
jgi:hypothetical protein